MKKWTLTKFLQLHIVAGTEVPQQIVLIQGVSAEILEGEAKVAEELTVLEAILGEAEVVVEEEEHSEEEVLAEVEEISEEGEIIGEPIIIIIITILVVFIFFRVARTTFQRRKF